jgi:hypothetical protein
MDMKEDKSEGSIDDIEVTLEESDEGITSEMTIDLETAPSMARVTDTRASGHCTKCGRYFSVPVIDGVPQCKCYTS